MTNLLHRNDKFAVVHNKFSKIPQRSLVHFASGVPRPCVVRLS